MRLESQNVVVDKTKLFAPEYVLKLRVDFYNVNRSGSAVLVVAALPLLVDIFAYVAAPRAEV